MAFDIASFKSNLRNGGARPNLFEVEVGNPIDGSADQVFKFHCRAAQLPASTIPAIDVPYFGRQVRVAGNRTFEPWTVTILNDEDFFWHFDVHIVLHLNLTSQTPIVCNLFSVEETRFCWKDFATTFGNLTLTHSTGTPTTTCRRQEDFLIT